MNVCVRRVAVSVGALLGVLLGLLDLAFFDDFFALDHAPTAILAAVLAFLAGHAAAGAVVVVYDLGADDLFLGGLVGAEAQTACDPLDELEQKYEGSDKDSKGDKARKELYDSGTAIVVIIAASVPFTAIPVVAFSLLTVLGETEGVVRIGHFHGVLVGI